MKLEFQLKIEFLKLNLLLDSFDVELKKKKTMWNLHSSSIKKKKKFTCKELEFSRLEFQAGKIIY